jgi:hypothetical protein
LLRYIKRKVARVTQFVQHFFQQASGKGVRSTALHSLLWGLAILVGSIPSCLYVGAPLWILATLVVAVTVLFAAFVVAFFFLLFKDRDALRSESFTLSKMAIERGLIGDNLSGLMEAPPTARSIIGAGDEFEAGDEEEE